MYVIKVDIRSTAYSGLELKVLAGGSVLVITFLGVIHVDIVDIRYT